MEKNKKNIKKCESIEEALRATEEKYKILYETSRDAIMIVGPEKGFLNGNKATIEMFEWRDEREFVSMTPAQVSPEYQPDGELSTEKAQKMMKKAFKYGSYFFEWKHKRKTGTDFFCNGTSDKTELLDQTNKELKWKIEELEVVLSHIKRLEGFVPICANCKKMRKENGNPKDSSSWIPIEKYISERTEANFTHGLCPDCVSKMYGKMRRKSQEGGSGI